MRLSAQSRGMTPARLPRDPAALDRWFMEGSLPAKEDLLGVLHVGMLTGLPSLRRLDHQKVFIQTRQGEVRGWNLILGGLRWGRFRLQEGVSSLPGQRAVMVIDYDCRGNYLSRSLCDHVVCLEPETLYLGRLHYKSAGKLRFLGYFSLSSH